MPVVFGLLRLNLCQSPLMVMPMLVERPQVLDFFLRFLPGTLALRLPHLGTCLHGFYMLWLSWVMLPFKLWWSMASRLTIPLLPGSTMSPLRQSWINLPRSHSHGLCLVVSTCQFSTLMLGVTLNPKGAAALTKCTSVGTPAPCRPHVRVPPWLTMPLSLLTLRRYSTLSRSSQILGLPLTHQSSFACRFLLLDLLQKPSGKSFVDLNMSETDFQQMPDHDDVFLQAQTIEDWGRALEHCVHGTLQAGKGSISALTQAYKGRRLPPKVVTSPITSPVRVACQGSYEPSTEVLSISFRRKVTQVRRVESLLEASLQTWEGSCLTLTRADRWNSKGVECCPSLTCLWWAISALDFVGFPASLPYMASPASPLDLWCVTAGAVSHWGSFGSWPNHLCQETGLPKIPGWQTQPQASLCQGSGSHCPSHHWNRVRSPKPSHCFGWVRSSPSWDLLGLWSHSEAAPHWTFCPWFWTTCCWGCLSNLHCCGVGQPSWFLAWRCHLHTVAMHQQPFPGCWVIERILATSVATWWFGFILSWQNWDGHGFRRLLGRCPSSGANPGWSCRSPAMEETGPTSSVHRSWKCCPTMLSLPWLAS